MVALGKKAFQGFLVARATLSSDSLIIISRGRTEDCQGDSLVDFHVFFKMRWKPTYCVDHVLALNQDR